MYAGHWPDSYCITLLNEQPFYIIYTTPAPLCTTELIFKYYGTVQIDLVFLRKVLASGGST
jgi:hypothetical protein